MVDNTFPEVFVGLRRFFNFDPLNPLTFPFTNSEDEFENISVFDIRGELPWSSKLGTQPNDGFGAGFQECVQWSLPESLWFNLDCSLNRRVLCQTPLNFNLTSSNVNETENKLFIVIFGVVVCFLFFLETFILVMKTNSLSKLESKLKLFKQII